MGKKIKKILIILLIIVFAFFLINIVLYICITKGNDFNIKKAIHRKNLNIEEYAKTYRYRLPNGEDDKPYNIVLFGCAFVEGLGLKDNQTFSAKLSEYTNKKVYNRGIGGGGIQHALIQIKSHELDPVIKNSKYVIYTLSSIQDLDRLYCYPGLYTDPFFLFDEKIYPRFVLKNDELKLYKSKIPYIDGSILYRLANKFIIATKYNFLNTKNVDYSFAMKHFIDLKNEIKKINPDAKFIIVLYWDSIERFKDEDIALLNKENIEIIEISKLVNQEDIQKMRNSYNHPTEEAWNQIVPKLVEKIGIN